MKETRALPTWFSGTGRKISVLLIGAGGNGSEFFDGCVRIHSGLEALGAEGLDVTVLDDDEVSEANCVRQRYYPHEVGLKKAIALVQRSNLLMGTNWKAVPERLEKPLQGGAKYDLIVTAVDNVAARALVAKSHAPQTLWLDLGCDKAQGQVVLGQLGHNKLTDTLPTVLAHWPDMLKQEDNNVPSCSAADSIRRQDLMVNSAVAGAAINLLWQSLRKGVVPYNGVMIDLEDGFSQAIPFMPL